MRVLKTSVVWRLLHRPNSSGLRSYFFRILMVGSVLPIAPMSTGQELLWCSGARAASPLCVEFKEALDARTRARNLYERLSSVEEGPWDAKKLFDATSVYQEATDLFADEYFGDAGQLFEKSAGEFELLLNKLDTAILDRRLKITEVGVTRRFTEAVSATHELEKWRAGDFTNSREHILAMIGDEKLIEEAGLSLEMLDFDETRRKISLLETDVFSTERNQLLKKLSEAAAKQRFAELIGLALEAKDNKKYSAAKRYFVEARAIDPKSTTVISNLNQIAKLERSIEIERLRAERQIFIEAENFSRALDLTEKLEALDPSFAFGEQKEFLRDAVKYEKELDLLLPQMTTLVSSKLRKALESFMREVDDDMRIAEFGERFNEKYKALKKRYQDLAVKAVFELTSDGKSDIHIRPGGRLGKFKQMTLKVYPGPYKLIARCPGLKENVKSLQVSLGGAPIESYIDCFE